MSPRPLSATFSAFPFRQLEGMGRVSGKRSADPQRLNKEETTTKHN